MNILITICNDITHDARLHRQIDIFKSLAKNVGLLCFAAPKIEGIETALINPVPGGLIRKSEKLYRHLLGVFNEEYDFYLYDKTVDSILKSFTFKPEVILINEPFAVPLSMKIKKALSNQPSIIVDLHEYYTEMGGQFRYRLVYKKYFNYILRTYVTKADAVTTVSKYLAEKYKEEFGIDPIVIYNAPPYYELKAKRCNRKKIKLVHHGNAFRERKLEKLIYLMKKLKDSFELHLYLLGDQAYIEELKKLSGELKNKKIFFHPAISPPEKIPGVINQYDIGIYLLERNVLNHALSLPNKFFEFIQARLMVFFTPAYYEVNDIVQEYKPGIVTKTFDVDEAAEILNNLTPEQIMKYKENADRAAKIFHAGNEEKKLKKLIEEVVKNRKSEHR